MPVVPEMAFSTRAANLQVGPGGLPELQLISRLQRLISLEKMTALEGRLNGITLSS